MKLFWLDITLNKSNKVENTKSKFLDEKKKWFSGSSFWTNWYSYVWNNMSACWDIVIWSDTFYGIQRENNEALAYKNKIVAMVWQNWIYTRDNKWEEIFDWKEIDEIKEVFSFPTFKRFKEKFFIQKFCSWELTIYPAQTALWWIKAQILDSRTIRKELDNVWNITYISQNMINKERTLKDVYHNILMEDPNAPQYWLSIYNWVVMDALSDIETSKRQLYFFKNDSRPNMFVMLDWEQFQTQDQMDNAIEMLHDKYSWSWNNHKAMVAPFIKDIKVLELSNKDLDLLNLRKFAIQKLWIAFQIDPRLIWFKEWWSGNNAEYVQVAREASEVIRTYAWELEENMTSFYRQFVNKNFLWQIKLKSDSFDDKITILQMCLDSVKEWIINRVEARQKIWLSIDDSLWVWWSVAELPQDLEKFTIQTNTTNISNVDWVITTNSENADWKII